MNETPQEEIVTTEPLETQCDAEKINADIKAKPIRPAVHITKEKVFTAFQIIGPILLVLSFLYWFGGLHHADWKHNPLIMYFPNADEHLLIPIAPLWAKIDSMITVDANGKFGIQLIAIAFILIFVSKPPKREKYTLKSLYTVSKLIAVSILLWHWFATMLEEELFFAGMHHYIFIFIICYAIGRVSGALYKRITKA